MTHSKHVNFIATFNTYSIAGELWSQVKRKKTTRWTTVPGIHRLHDEQPNGQHHWSRGHTRREPRVEIAGFALSLLLAYPSSNYLKTTGC